MGREIHLPALPERIISLVPSQTELLADLGLSDKIVGITKFCIYPNHIFKSKNKIGGTKSIDYKKIKALNPDLIIANKEENDASQIEKLMGEFPVWISNIVSIKDALSMIHSIGEFTKTSRKATEIISSINNQFNILETKIKLKKSSIRTVAYFIWKDPYIVVGENTFIDYILEKKCRFRNIFHNKARYPTISIKDITDASPDYLFLSSEPYPFKERHILEFQKLLPKSKIILVDGEMFSWYGSRLMQAPNYFSTLI